MWPTNMEPLGELRIVVLNDDGSGYILPIDKCIVTVGSEEE
ncbi:hypothetical protein [Shouchella clausii]|nr:hypothetical protein [Shouchella clausii]